MRKVLTRRSWFPQAVAFFAVYVPGRDEQKIRKTIDIGQRGQFHMLVLQIGQRDHHAFGAAGDCSGEMQMRCCCGSSWQHEGFERREFAVQPVNLLFEAVDLRLHDR